MIDFVFVVLTLAQIYMSHSNNTNVSKNTIIQLETIFIFINDSL